MQIVIIISIKLAERTLHIEKWALAPPVGHRPTTRAFSNNPGQNQPLVPTNTHEITITPNNVNGAPLILEFRKMFLRPAVPPEIDIIFTAQDLSIWAADFWQLYL